MRFALTVTVILLSGCAGSFLSSQASWTGGSGDIDLSLDCRGHMDLEVLSEVPDGELFFAILDGAGEAVKTYDLADDDLVKLNERLKGAAGTWRLGGSYDSMEAAGSVRISC